MKIKVQTQSFIANIAFSIIFIGLSIWAIIYGVQAEESFRWLAGLGSLGLFYMMIYPILTAWDLGDDIPEIKELKKSNPLYKKTKIRLPAFWWVVLWCVLGAMTFGITWLLALFLTSGNVDAEITDDIAFASGLSENFPNKTTNTKQDAIGVKTEAADIMKWKELLDNGAISEEEFNVKKSELLK